MTLTIDQLEKRNSRAIRRVLRKFMKQVDANQLESYIKRELKRFPANSTKDIHKIVSNTYNEGYIYGGRQIRHHRPLTAAEFEGTVDPLISQYTLVLIDSLTLIIDHTKDEMVDDLKEWYAQGWSYDRIRTGLLDYFDNNPTSANRMARTMTNDIFNRATERRYETSGVVEGAVFSAMNDERTSKICEMLDGTIWALGDPDIRRPPRHFNCLVAGTQISTKNGNKNIETVNINDQVLTHKNRFRKVTDKFTSNSNELIEIRTKHRTIKITSNHPILALKNGTAVWIIAGELTTKDQIIIT